MENEKRILLAIILSIAVLFLYQSLFAPPPKKTSPRKEAVEEALPEDPQIPASQRIKAPEAMPEIRDLPDGDSVNSVKADGPESLIRVSNDLFNAVFCLPSARIKSFSLLQYRDSIEKPWIMKFIHSLLSSGDDQDSARNQEDAFKNLIKDSLSRQDALPLRASFIGADGSVLAVSPWTSNADSLVVGSGASEASLLLTGTGNTNLEVRKELTFSQNNYRIDLNLTFSNKSDSALSGNAFMEWTSPFPEKKGGGFFSAGMNNNTQFSYFINGKVEKKALHDIESDIVLEGDILWTAIEEKYFTSAVVPLQEKPSQIRVSTAGKRIAAYQIIFPQISLQPGQDKSYGFSLYMGPKDIDILKQQGFRLEKTIDFGFFDIIAKPLLLSLKFFYRFIGNYGLAIILITIIIKIIFWPLTHKSYTSMKGMQSIQPEIAALKEKYKDNKEEFAKQQMSLYKKYKVNPLGGCLPMLLQIPVFIALYRVLGDSIELRHANFISFWINDLSAKDPTYITPLLMGLSMLVQQKMTPTAADPAQAKMMMFMPIIFTVMFLNFPSGLVIYWLVNNVISVAQQIYTNKKSHDPGGAECSPSKSKQKPSKKRSR